MKSAQKAMIYKDVKEVIGNKMLLMPMIIVPMVFVLIFPIIIFITAGMETLDISDMEPLMAIIGSKENFDSQTQLIIHMTINYMYPAFFLIIPIMTSSILGASSFVGEKERKTMETLLYTPLSIKDLFVSKVIATFVPAYAVTVASFLVLAIVANIGGWIYFGSLIFPNIKWLITILWISPVITLLGIIFMVIVSARVDTFQEAQQMSALIVVPVIGLIVGQATGLFLLSELILLITGGIIGILDYFLIKIATRKFKPEQLI